MLAANQKVINSSFQEIVQRTTNYLKLTLPNKMCKSPGLQLLKLLFISGFALRGPVVGVGRGGMNRPAMVRVSETTNPPFGNLYACPLPWGMKEGASLTRTRTRQVCYL